MRHTIGSRGVATHSHIVCTLALAVLVLAAAAAPAAAQAFTTLHSFSGTDGHLPVSDLIMDSAGNLFGTTSEGGSSTACTNGCGTVFELVKSPSGYTETVLHSFSAGADGASPLGVIMDSSGNLYGTTAYGGGSSNCTGGCGTMFELVKTSGYSETTLHAFAGSSGGSIPTSGLVMDSSGNLYGTTEAGGTSGEGLVFELVKSSGYAEMVLHTFTGPDGNEPMSGLIMDSAGNLYGTAAFGGGSSACPKGCGTVFELTKSSLYAETTLLSFNGANGANPYAKPIIDSSGNLYGTTYMGGASGYGTVFELAKASTGSGYSEALLHAFSNFTAGDGAYPTADLVMDSAGNLFGTTYSGGVDANNGSIFELVKSSGYSESMLYSFSGGNDGRNPGAGVIEDSLGDLFGAAAYGGAAGDGAIFAISGPPQTTATTLASSTNPSDLGDAVVLTATVTSASGTPSGSVTFFDGSATLGTEPLVAVSGAVQATFTSSDLAAGSHTLVAQYNPDAPPFVSSGSTALTETVVSLSGLASLSGNNTFTGNQTVNGTMTASSFFGDGFGLTDLNPANLNTGTAGISITGTAGGLSCLGCVSASQLSVNYAGSASQGGPATSAIVATEAGDSANLGGVGSSNYARLDIGNYFNGNEAIAGNLSASGSLTIGGASSTGPLTIGGGTPITQHLSILVNPAFAALKPGDCRTADFAMKGAADGDTAALGVPSSRMTGGGNLVYTAWVGAPDTITLQACNANGHEPQKAAGSGAIRVDLWKH
jgi:uncharacterized repeat protein (TIGR03803 family)